MYRAERSGDRLSPISHTHTHTHAHTHTHTHTHALSLQLVSECVETVLSNVQLRGTRSVSTLLVKRPSH